VKSKEVQDSLPEKQNRLKKTPKISWKQKARGGKKKKNTDLQIRKKTVPRSNFTRRKSDSPPPLTKSGIRKNNPPRKN
jgi:hypothetical protein